MRVSRGVLCVLTFFSALSYLYPTDVHAYLDPGTGSYMLQLVLAAVLGAAFAVKIFWFRIKLFFANLLSKKPKDK